MATQPQDERTASAPITITDSTGETVTLDAAYFRRSAEARRARLALPPLSDEELAERRARYPDQAWYWTRERQDGEREVDGTTETGRHGPIFDGDEELQAALDAITFTS